MVSINAEDKEPIRVDDGEEEFEDQQVERKHCQCVSDSLYPWLVLSSICFLTFGSYWVYDTPGAIQTPLTWWFGNSTMGRPSYNYTNTDNSLLYSVYSWPNVVLAFFGGFIVDRFTGVRQGAFLFCSLVFMGQVIFALGIQFKYYWVCVFGRFFYGLGGESLTVAQSTFTARWFDGKLLALAFGITVSFSRIGSSVNFIVTPTLATHAYSWAQSVPVAIWFGTAMCVVSLVAVGIAALLDILGEDRIKEKPKNVDDEKPSLMHVRFFPLPAWNLMLTTMIFYIAVLVFYQVASDIMQNTGQMYSPTTASYFISIPNIVSIIASPLFGFIIDKNGRALWFIFFASLALVIAHLGFLYNAIAAAGSFLIPPAALMIWMGFAYSAGAAALWPILANIVHESLLATGYGTMTSLQNLGLAAAPLVVSLIQGHISDHTWHYAAPIIVFILCALTSAALTLLNIFLDKKFTDGRLNASGRQREILGPLPNPLAKVYETTHLLASDHDHDHDHDHHDHDYPPAKTDMGFEDDVVTNKIPLKRDNLMVRRMYLARLGINPLSSH
eukprot:CAMPEP_0184370298 /NCGR_PEP_ID=MMETSP1089-20130417/162740_1 /TAXON_ID=38269 ORGANISM="Gloeochaete wittrockiana, Strain SAG46.84" /NCGR_SAMPLE_ID=MMETSP1089 /ASSEMBLY_ACC=CAM_ASM_000445 /LENGTH=555 /DNA_ID=CAMNT_0026712879 /DNA_START=102 /DNA_END=1769 /DNA_ORIENTATION=+